jgi:ribosome-binding factor A
MERRRVARLNAQLKREISRIVWSEMRDPRIHGVVVTAVRVTPDLVSARVFVRVPGGDAERRAAVEALQAAAPFVRTLLGQELRVRRVPELRFEEDRTIETAQRIEEILRDVLPPDRNDDDPDLDE